MGNPKLTACLAGKLAHINGAVDFMTIIKQGIKTSNLKQEARQIRRTAQKVAASKESARRFLMSTGIYSANGQLKPAFR